MSTKKAVILSKAKDPTPEGNISQQNCHPELVSGS